MRRRSGTIVTQPDQEQQLRPLRRNQDASHLHQIEREQRRGDGLRDRKAPPLLSQQLRRSPSRRTPTPYAHNFCLKCFGKWIHSGKCPGPIPSKMAEQPSGGSDLSGNKRTNKEQSFDQKFEKMTAALRLSCGLTKRSILHMLLSLV